MDPGADHQPLDDVGVVAAGHDLHQVADRREGRDRRRQPDLTAEVPHLVGQRPGDGTEVDDSGVRRVQRRYPLDLRLEVAQPGAVEPGQVGDAVAPCAVLDPVQAGYLVG